MFIKSILTDLLYTLYMGKTHTEQVELKVRLDQAKKQVEIGAKYKHFKADHKIYTVLNLAFQEQDNALCVIYQAEYEERLVFSRPLTSWLEVVNWQNKKVPRFTKL